ncbi:14014_t:CDS:2 [Entrophospora sp. SA101]|nr:1282_t:CDS:2 [Entrophospora candida]CAJ0863457.1 14014_t:CDS:2 [Entrophospora sp. SA101]
MATATSSTTTNNNNIAASPETPFYFKQEQEETTISSITTSSSQSTNADKNYIPRPKNCFMAYREHIKEKFLIENPGINNKVVSVLAANMWNNEPEDVKEHWREQTKLKDSITNGATVTATTTNININNITTNIISNNSSNTTNTTTTNDTTSITNCRKKNVVDSKMIFADGFNNEIMCGDDNSNNKDDVKQKQPIYSLGLEGIATADDHEDIYLQHLQKKAIFGHYRSSSVDSLSSWTSDSTVSTPLLSPFAGSPASLSPPTFQCNNSTIYNEIDQLNQLYTRQIDVCSRGSLPVDDGFVLDSYNNQIIKSATVTDPSTTTATTYYQSSPMEMSATDYELMAMGHFADSPIEEHADHYSYALEGPRRHSQQLLAEFEDGIKQQQIMLHGLLIDPNAQNHQ